MSERDQLYRVEDKERDDYEAWAADRDRRISDSGKRQRRENLIGMLLALAFFFGCAIVCFALIVR